MDDTRAEHASGGPWLLGNQYTLADLFVTPFYERFDAVHRHYGKFEFPADSRFDRVRAHWRAALEHPSYLATRLDPNWLFRLYRPFAKNEEWISAENNKAVRDIVE